MVDMSCWSYFPRGQAPGADSERAVVAKGRGAESGEPCDLVPRRMHPISCATLKAQSKTTVLFA